METDALESQGFYAAYRWADKNRKPLMWGTLALIVVGLVVWWMYMQKAEKEIAAGRAISAALTASMTRGEPENPDAFIKVAQQFPNSNAGERAQLIAATALFTQGKYPEAQTQFEKFVREHRESIYLPQALFGIASCLDAAGKTTDAQASYKSLSDRHSSDPVAQPAKFALARIAESQNKPEEAFRLYEEVNRASPYGALGGEAGMRAEELKAKHPQLAVPPAMPAGMSNAASPSAPAPPAPK